MITDSGFKVISSFDSRLPISEVIIPYGCLSLTIVNSDIEHIIYAFKDYYYTVVQQKLNSIEDYDFTSLDIEREIFTMFDNEKSTLISDVCSSLVLSKEIDNLVKNKLYAFIEKDLMTKFNDSYTSLKNNDNVKSTLTDIATILLTKLSRYIKELKEAYPLRNEMSISNKLFTDVTLGMNKIYDSKGEPITVYNINSIEELLLADWSEYCNHESKNVIQCQWCRKLFIPDTMKHKYCSDVCRNNGKNPPASTLQGKYKNAKKKQHELYEEALGHVLTDEYKEVGISLSSSGYLYDEAKLKAAYDNWRDEIDRRYNKLLADYSDEGFREFTDFISRTRFTKENLKEYQVKH